ncbi:MULTISPECIES: AAA domain-containing protein [Brevundimonas]|uniref:AAA family ATPase n=1 Tax=Brevundimonas nasdae TaxID=172043 RepID=A0ABX8TPM1_9CAUL|nr:AAA domain-containing protein [Brevundimonas nasdae]QYC12000.1 AAA family ATPase [Brevundimonas nasdae]QYC14787.1 AAA family ATPase [Brevundimonas nasdae]
MSTRDYILRFLNQPETFASGATDPELWLQALGDFAAPLLEAGGGPALRPAQERAWEGLASTRAGLVLGPPGTGKTHLLAWLILGYILARRSAGLPARVFVSAFTRNAIGNLLDSVAARLGQFAPEAFEVHYLGAAPPAGLSDRIKHRASVAKEEGEAAFADLTAEAVVVGASVWQLHRLLSHKKAPGDGVVAPLFDLICIDEASQLVLSQGLMALSGLKPDGRIVVAGDDRQLPPIRAGRDVDVSGRQLGGSLYAFMKSAGAEEFALEETFRLNAPLTAFPEKTFYPGKYRSADAVREARLTLKPNWRDGLEPWEAHALDPDWPIAVLVHDGPPASSSNPFEAWASARLLEKLAERLVDVTESDGAYKGELWRERIAAVSPHRAQNAAIRNALPPLLRANAFVETVDRIQGKERDAVVLSYCVADTEFALAEADFIFARERLNVAVTRARHKLIVLISRRLLEASPVDQEQMDKAEGLREFVFDAALMREVEIIDNTGAKIDVQIRLVGFQDSGDLVDPPVQEPVATSQTQALTEEDEHLLQAVRDVALGNSYGTAASFELEKRLGRKPILPGLSRLQASGRIDLWQVITAKANFWNARPFDPARRIFPVDYETVKGRAEEVINQSKRGRKPPLYDDVRRQFAWVNAVGGDVVRPAFDRLRDEGLIQYSSDGERLRIEWTGASTLEPLPEPPEAPVLSDEDFAVLNALETLEARRINFGVFEGWTSAATLADGEGFSRTQAQAALGRLAANGWVLFAGEGRVRSRMAELAREVRYVKQRFDRDDADKRPFLVRSLKVELRNRDKPIRNEPLAAVFDGLAAELGGTHAQALTSLKDGLLKLWGRDAAIAGFQRRSLEALSRAWAGGGENAVVVSADTGAGKTEAAALPLIAGAAADRLAGVKGVRAVLAYPRIRLATNQAQRLVRYAGLLSREPGAPRLTVGMQFKGTPNRLDALQSWDLDEGWRMLSEGELIFPLFGCPECAQTLHLHRGAGHDRADRLACVACDWSFDGWIGSKLALRETPPALFIITTDSLHQWMHTPIAGRLFGDDPDFAPPRAVMADEIHLYSHVHGAQVALALQRLSARTSMNAPDAPPMLMVGMSATLGDPAATWGRLAGRANVLSIAASATEKQINPRGREYFYFIQPEVESRGADIAGASTTIQSLMCLAHGMRRRTDSDGGFRSVVFLDSIDKVRRLHGDYTDAEEGKELASYRTRKYPEDPATGVLPTQCCGEPYGCDRFQSGECWVFAATDPAQVGAQGLRRPGQPLSIIDRPVTSASTGRVEDAIKASDVVFATSSLEVGYDDPDITLVYQHYAPQNLASFVQRKGRGGRGSDDRPITAVTLSIYTSRDSWWFKRPWTMLEPTGFDSPLNPDNFFVRRGQIVSTILDAFARFERRAGPFNPQSPPPAALAEAEALVRLVFGEPVWEGYASDLAAFWALALAKRNGKAPGEGLPRLRADLEWAPDLLFDSINLPRLNIIRAGEVEPRAEDVSLATATVAPGGATRRYHPVEVDWRPPVAGQGPWLAAQDYASALVSKPFGDDPAAWLERLPREARTLLPGLAAEYVRPRQITLQRLGQVHGATWIADFGLDAADVVVPAGQAPANRQIGHQSHSHLRGFPILKPTDDQARALPTEDLAPWVEAFSAFLGDGVGGKTTGLALARVFWGADAELVLTGPPRETLPITQVFTSPGKGPTLHGYHVQTEGVRYRLNAERLGVFLDAEEARVTVDDQVRKRVVGALVRWKVESGAQALGLNMFQMRRAGELIASALADPAYQDRLRRIAFLWNTGDIAALFEDVRADLLACHPLLSPDRVAKVAGAFSDDRLKPILSDALRAAGNPGEIRAWLHSAVVHSLALRLKDSFVHVGHGDDRQVLVHAVLPLQFGADVAGGCDITICEVGNHGDGTTRAFVARAGAGAGHWRDGFLGDCPNASEDAALDRLFSLQEHHAEWRALDPNDPDALRTLAAPLGLDPDMPLPAGVLRVLFGVEAVGSERFDLYDLALAVRGSSLSLQARLGRPPTAWEATSVAVRGAESQPDSVLNHLLAAYGGLEEGLQEEGLSARGRLADQVYRLSARLCVDGCPACVHRPSDLMSEGLMESSTSRELLTRFLCQEA